MNFRSNAIYERLVRDQNRIVAAGLLRELPSSLSAGTLIDLATNSYLCLHENSAVAAEAERLAGSCTGGNLASRLVSQRSSLYQDLEQELQSWTATERALVFSSGYVANLGILTTLCSRETEVFCDRLNHASIYDGIKLSGALLTRYRHGDMGDLSVRLEKSKAREKLVITESVFSMDGDRAPLADIAELGSRHGAMVVVDEAHATGIMGREGCGAIDELGVADGVQVHMGTLSKAVAGLGGFFCGSELVRTSLVNRARSFIYSTGLPPAVVAYDLAAVRAIRKTPGLGTGLLNKAEYVRDRLNRLGLCTQNSSTQIVPVIAGSESSALALAKFLRENGIIAPAIRPPTVPAGTARVRLSLHCGLANADLETIVDVLGRWVRDALPLSEHVSQ